MSDRIFNIRQPSGLIADLSEQFMMTAVNVNIGV